MRPDPGTPVRHLATNVIGKVSGYETLSEEEVIRLDSGDRFIYSEDAVKAISSFEYAFYTGVKNAIAAIITEMFKLAASSNVIDRQAAINIILCVLNEAQRKLGANEQQ